MVRTDPCEGASREQRHRAEGRQLNRIYYTNALQLLVCSICVVIYVTHEQLTNTSIEIRVGTDPREGAVGNGGHEERHGEEGSQLPRKPAKPVSQARKASQSSQSSQSVRPVQPVKPMKTVKSVKTVDWS